MDPVSLSSESLGGARARGVAGVGVVNGLAGFDPAGGRGAPRIPPGLACRTFTLSQELFLSAFTAPSSLRSRFFALFFRVGRPSPRGGL